jgi:hypothetical protein
MPLESEASVQEDTLSYMSKYRNPRHAASRCVLMYDRTPGLWPNRQTESDKLQTRLQWGEIVKYITV